MSKISHVIPSLRLALNSVKFDGEKVVSGWVVNGGWYLCRKGNEWQAKAGKRIVTRWEAAQEDDVVLQPPSEVPRDYNDAILWALAAIAKAEAA